MTETSQPLLSLLGATGMRAYAALDAAGIPGLPERLKDPAAPRSQCLYSGELAPELAGAAPYLVELPLRGGFIEWLLSGWGSSWGVLMLAPEALDFAALRRHLRKLNLVYGPGAEPALFRWYDPRVLRVVAPELDAAQLRELFGPLHRFVFEGGSPRQGLVLELAGDRLVSRSFSMPLMK